MRKPILYIFCFIMALFLSSCSQSISEEPEPPKAEQSVFQSEPVHAHAGQGPWHADTKMHWRFCSCGKRADVGAHILSAEEICSDCGYHISSDGNSTCVSLLNAYGDPEKTALYSSGNFINEQYFEYEYGENDGIIGITAYENGKPVSKKSYDPKGSLSSESVSKDGGLLFKNYADGYSFSLPEWYDFDSSLSETVTVLENEDTRIEVYKQSLSHISSGSYRRFSNAFLKNSIDHKLSFRGYKTIGGRSVYITQWHREPLKRLGSDKNHYVSFDITRSGYIYSFFIKSSAPIKYSDYNGLLESLEFFSPSADHAVWKSKNANPEIRGWNEETSDFFERYFSEDAALSWGMFDPDSAYGDLTKIKSYESALNYKFPVILTYFGLSEKSYSKLKDTLENSWENGNVLELTIQTYAAEDGGNASYDILNGEYDGALEYYARTIRNFGHPVLFRLMNEMNGDWCPYSAYHTSKDTLIYKEVYRYVYSVFERVGANNVIWIWNPNESSFPDFDWNNTLMYYPGDEYVDVVGMTAYNTGTYYKGYGEKWKTFSQLYDGLYEEYCRHFSQPFMITEFSCAKMGGNKTAWVEDMLQRIDAFDRIKLAVWWNHADLDARSGEIARNYFIDDPASVLEAFKNHLK